MTQNEYIFVSKKNHHEIVYGNERFYVNKAGSYVFDFRHNGILIFLLLVLIEGSIWGSQYMETFFYRNKPIAIVFVAVSIYIAAKLSSLLIKRLGLGYRRKDLKRLRIDINIDKEMIGSCQKKYISYVLKEAALVGFAIVLYSLFFFTVRLYGLIYGMLLMTAFCMMRKMANYPVYRNFMKSYQQNHKVTHKEAVEEEIEKAYGKKRNG